MQQQILPVLLKASRDGLDALGRRYAVVGGVAVNARGLLRGTRDVDMAVPAEDDADAESVAYHFIRRGWSVETEIDHKLTGRLMGLRLRPPATVVPVTKLEESEPPLVDLLFSSCGLEDELARDASTESVFGQAGLPIATIPYLIAMKLISENTEWRGQDRQDLLYLIRAATPAQLDAVPALLDLVKQRGYDRGRDLPASYDHFKRIAFSRQNPWDE